MRSMTVKTQVLLLIGTILLTLLSLGYTGYSGNVDQGNALFDMDSKMSALRTQMEADMMHDAIRGDVMNALYLGLTSGDAAALQAQLDGFKAHMEQIQTDFDEITEMDVSPEVNAALGEVEPVLVAYGAAAEELIMLAMGDVAQAQAKLPEFTQAFEDLEEKMSAVGDLIESGATDATILASEVSGSTLSLMMWFIIGSVVVIVGGAALMLRSILKPLRALYQALVAIGSNKGDLERLQGFSGEFRDVEKAFNVVLDNMEAKRAEEAQQASAAFRVQQALNEAATSTVLTNAEGEVIYINETARKLFAQHENEIRRSLPDFAVARLVGGSLARMFTSAATVAAIQSTVKPRHDDVVLGNRVFLVTSTAVLDAGGNRLGAMCEWHDKTEQREAERQIEKVLGEAINGRFDARLDVSFFRGFLQVVATSVNSMLDAITVPLRSAAGHLQAIAEGQIPDPITTEFKGDFNEIRNNLNTCSKVLKALIKDTTMLVDAASRGKLDERVDVSTHWGDYRAIVEGMNNTLDAVAKPVSEVKTVITGFASGDLTKRMNGKYAGDFAVLSDAVNTSVSNLVDMVSKINNSSSNINSSASEISTGNQNLNDRTQEQAAALEETSAALAGLTSKAEENTANASNANELAQSATAEARKGGEIVSNAVRAMGEIDAASKKIADIISVIDGIAFQTNLLALNASVEAARAGDQGKGFAVVANEVRALAGRSATAAQEIKLLINDTVDKVNHGTKLVNDSGSTLRDIVDSVSKVGVIISEISAATSDQMSGFLEVSKAINQLDDMTQQNAAMVEEAAAASESMADQSDTLRDLMKFFKSDKDAINAFDKTPAKAAIKPAAIIAAPKPVSAKPAAAAKELKPIRKAPVKLAVASSKPHDDGHWDEF